MIERETPEVYTFTPDDPAPDPDVNFEMEYDTLAEKYPLPPKMQNVVRLAADSLRAGTPLDIIRWKNEPKLTLAHGDYSKTYAIIAISKEDYQERAKKTLPEQDVIASRLAAAGVPFEPMLSFMPANKRVDGNSVIPIVYESFPFLLENAKERVPDNCNHLPYIEALSAYQLGVTLMYRLIADLPKKNLVGPFEGKDASSAYKNKFEEDIRDVFTIVNEQTGGEYSDAIQKVRLQMLRDWSSRRDYRFLYYNGLELVQEVNEKGQMMGLESFPYQANDRAALYLITKAASILGKNLVVGAIGGSRKNVSLNEALSALRKDHAIWVEEFHRWNSQNIEQAKSGDMLFEDLGYKDSNFKTRFNAYVESVIPRNYKGVPSFSQEVSQEALKRMFR